MQIPGSVTVLYATVTILNGFRDTVGVVQTKSSFFF